MISREFPRVYWSLRAEVASLLVFTCSKSSVGKQNNLWICLNSTLRTQERCHWRHSGVFIVNFEQTSHFPKLFCCFHRWLWTSKSRLGKLLIKIKKITTDLSKRKLSENKITRFCKTFRGNKKKTRKIKTRTILIVITIKIN